MHDYSNSDTLCNLSWLRGFQIEYSEIISSMSDARLLQMMAYLNFTVYHIANRGDVFSTRGVIRVENLKNLINNSILGSIKIQVTTEYLSKKLKAKWGKAYSSENSIRVAREILSETFGIFKFNRVAPRSTWQPPVLYDYDLPKALALYEALEQEYLSRDYVDPKEDGGRRNRTLSDLPNQFGTTMMNLFNAAFAGVASYGRVDDEIEALTIGTEKPMSPHQQDMADPIGYYSFQYCSQVDWAYYFKRIYKKINDARRKVCEAHRKRTEQRQAEHKKVKLRTATT